MGIAAQRAAATKARADFIRAFWSPILGSSIGLSGADAPSAWTDKHGKAHRTSQARNWRDVSAKERDALRGFVVDRDGALCRACGSSSWLNIDHVMAQRNGGAHHPGNLQLLCLFCNSRKGGLVDKKAGHGLTA